MKQDRRIRRLRAAAQLCPRCGAVMEGGLCPNCGFPLNRKRPWEGMGWKEE